MTQNSKSNSIELIESPCFFYSRKKNHMNFVEKYYLLERIAQFIRQEKTGSLEEFASKCGIKNKDMLFDYIEILRQFAGRDNAKILYDRSRKTYYFSPWGKFTDFGFVADGC